jgi:hypothetical protein
MREIFSKLNSQFCSFSGNFFTGADRLLGGIGNDIIYHGVERDPTGTDFHKDFIDCSPGNDEAFIDVSHDNDVALNYETVHAG